MRSSDMSAEEFLQLTIDSLLGLCTNSVAGHHIVSIEGRLLLTLNNGDQVDMNILQQDINSSLSNSVKAEDRNISPSGLISDANMKLDGDALLTAETELTADASVGLKSLDDALPVDEVDAAASADEMDLHTTTVDEGDRSDSAFAEVMPSAMLQPNGEFKCSRCGVKMKCARTIKRHVLSHIISLQLSEPSTTHHPETANEADGVITNTLMQECPEAQKQGGVNKKLSVPENRKIINKDHRKGISKEWRSYRCKDCGDVFTSSTHVTLHRANMHRPHECQKCGAVMIGRLQFSQHVRSEHPGLKICKALKSLVCEYCSRTFHHETLLKDHIATVHLGSVEHRCDQCGKVLGSAITLKIHQRQQHERRFLQTCDGCGRQFLRLESLICHLRSTHPHLLPAKYRNRLDEFFCKECNLSFSRRPSFKRHCKVKHGGEPNHICPVCSRCFRCERYVRRHIRSHHPGFVHVNVAAGKVLSAVDIGNSDVLQRFVSDDELVVERETI